MREIISKIYCWLFKHDFITEGSMDNGRSKWGSYRCARCGKIHNWQNDYMIN